MPESSAITLTAIAAGGMIAGLCALVGDWGSAAVIAGVFLITAGTLIALDPLRRD